MKLKAVLCDVDGVLTDGRLHYSAEGEITKIFSARDGWGFKKLKEKGFVLGILSGKDSNALRKRLSDLPIDFQALGQDTKIIGYERFKAKFQLSDSEIAYIGDDELDIPILKQVGFACVPSDAHPAAVAASHEQLPAKGGSGVLRCLADLLCVETNHQPLPKFNNSGPLVGIVGMNVIEDEELVRCVAAEIKAIAAEIEMPIVFKASFDKANRSSIHSYRGIGMSEGLRILGEIKDSLNLPIITDIHEPHQAAPVSEVADILQIPAFLCRQTDLLRAAVATERPLHIKKMQLMAPQELRHTVEKCRSFGSKAPILLCERGTLFGYHNLVVDPLSFHQLKALNCPVTFDVTHALQLPGAGKHTTLGRSNMAPHLMRAGVVQGIAAIFVECHPEPQNAKCDGPCATPLSELKALLKEAKALDNFVKSANLPNSE